MPQGALAGGMQIGQGRAAPIVVLGGANIAIAAGAEGEQVRWYTADLNRGPAIALGVSQLALFGAGAVDASFKSRASGRRATLLQCEHFDLT